MGLVLNKFKSLLALRDEVRPHSKRRERRIPVPRRGGLMECAVSSRFDDMLSPEIPYGAQPASRFSLCAVIVHDPRDEGLMNRLKTGMGRFGRMTGPNLLFITFVEPSMKVKLDFRDDDSLIFNDAWSVEEDSRRYDRFFRTMLHADELGSFIAVTEDFSSQSYYKIPISAFDINDKLWTLTDVADSLKRGDRRYYNDFINGRNVTEIKLGTSFHDRITNIFALLPEQTHGQEHIDNIKKSVSALWQTLPDNPECDLETVEKAVSNITEAITLLEDMTGTVKLNSNLRIPTRLLEGLSPESKKFARSYNLVCSILDGQENIDYSGLTIYLGKIIEREYNFSVGQWIRYWWGIEMPQYFGRWAEAAGRVVVEGEPRVSLNKRENDGTLKLIPLGQMKHAYNSSIPLDLNFHIVTPAGACAALPMPLSDECLDRWGYFASQYRNPASHAVAHCREDLEAAYGLFLDIMEQDMPVMYQIRDILSTGASAMNA